MMKKKKMKVKKKKSFPDVSGDGKITKKDILMARGVIKKPGSLRKSLNVKKGEKIPAAKLKAAAKKPGKLGQRARFAITLGKLRKK